MLAAFGLAGRFKLVILGDDLNYAKKHPPPYLSSLGALGVDANEAM